MTFESIYAVIGIPVIFMLGFSGSLIPPLVAYFYPAYNITKKYYFSFFNGFAAGVILAVGFIHSLADSQTGFAYDVYYPAEYNLTDNYPWADWITMMAIIILFTLEEIMAIIANRFGIQSLDPHYNGIDARVELSEVEDHGHELRSCDHTVDDHLANDGQCEAQPLEEACDHHAKPTVADNKGADEESSDSSSSDDDAEDNKSEDPKKLKQGQRGSINMFLKMILLFIGLDIHNVFVGLALGIANNDYVLFIALLFHQFFEGLGMGSRVAMAKLRSIWAVLAIDLIFSLTPSIFIAIGIGIKQGVQSANSTYAYNMAKAILQGLSAGILIFIALVHMMRAYRDNGASAKHRDLHSICSYFGLLLGAACLSVIGIWA